MSGGLLSVHPQSYTRLQVGLSRARYPRDYFRCLSGVSTLSAFLFGSGSDPILLLILLPFFFLSG